METTGEIKTYTMPDMPPVKERLKDITQTLQKLTVEDLKRYHGFFPDTKISGLEKKRLIKVLAETMTFETEKDFRAWFFRFPALAQKLLYRLAFDYFVPAKELEKEFGSPLVQQISEYSWTKKWALQKEIPLDISVFDQCGQAILYLPGILRNILTLWLVPPPGLKLEECAADGGGGPVWDNSAEIADSLPLLYDAIVDFLGSVKPPDSPYKCIRGFKKKDADSLRMSSAFKPFTVPDTEDIPGEDAAGAEDQKTSQKKGRKAAKGNDLKAQYLIPDSADLTARFILAMKNFMVVRPADGQDEVKALVKAFFNETSQFTGYINPSDRHSLEYNVLFDHVTKGTDYYLKYEGGLPPSRGTFRDILMFCAKDGRTFDADQIARLIFRTLRPFFFYYKDTMRILKYRADEITVDGQTYSEKYSDIFSIEGILEYYLVVTPVFKAYCYLFAALGILEITQTMPPLTRVLKEKKRPISCYDSLKTFRVTEFGKWCLELTKKRPARVISEYQAIADKELFLVTVQGNSLERTIYLDKIGRKLGSNRWRISPDSFIAGCSEKKHIEERVAKFKALIDPNPAPHWLTLFEKTINRAGLFDYSLSGQLIYQLPADRSLSEELLGDPELRSLIHRAEGGLIVIPEKNLKKFQALLNAHGIVVFGRD
ncbi:MAG: hypothetical protein LBF74_09560 [Treponema sp.]|jgi:hypothetical protein|nr:hypothetical protein [Treponema sp.]